MAFSFVTDKVSTQQDLSRYRQRQMIQGCGREISVDGKDYLNFSSNDYLGLAGHSRIKQAFMEGVDRFGTSSSSSSLVTGYHYAHQHLEEILCQWLGVESCLLFSSGFAANAGVLSALGESGTTFILDKLSHASLIDGARFGKGKFARYSHNDMTHLAAQLAKSANTDRLVVTESVFSMDGDQAPLADVNGLCLQHDAWLLVDEAHGLGVLGSTGAGGLHAQGIAPTNRHLIMGTFGKALGTAGAFVGGSRETIEYLVNFCRHYIYSTSLPPALAWATAQAIEQCQQDTWRREKLAELTALFGAGLADNIKLVPSNTSIQALITVEESRTLDLSAKLRSRGFWLTAIRPPTVPDNKSRLRVTITASHNSNDIKALINQLNEVLG